MSRWSVWQIGRGGAVERVGTYTSGADARRVLRATILSGAAVDPDGEVSEARGVSPAHVTAIEAAAEAWLATVNDTEPVGVGAATEAPLPIAFESPVVEDDVVERLRIALADATARAVAAEEATARMQAVLDGVRATAAALDTRAERAEAERDQLAASLRERSEQLDAARRTIAKLRAELAATHPVVRVAAKPRAVRKTPSGETPVGTLFRVIRERARGVR